MIVVVSQKEGRYSWRQQAQSLVTGNISHQINKIPSQDGVVFQKLIFASNTENVKSHKQLHSPV
jgi:hypothetical protein